jgi:single-stranded DNA-binding protein
LALDQWNDKNNGEKRQKHKIILEAFHFVDGKQEDGSGGGSTEYSSNTPRSTSSARSGSGFSKSNMDDSDGPAGAGSGGAEEEVPF